MDKKKQQQQARRKQEDAVLNKLLIWFGAAIAYEAVVLLLKRFYINFHTEAEVNFAWGLSRAFNVLWWLAPVLTIAAAVWLVMSKKQDKPLRVPVICTIALFVVSFTSIACHFFFDVGVDVLGVVAPVAAVLSLVFYLYQREFFYNTIITGCGIFSLWMYRRFFMDHPNAIRAGFVLGWVLLAAAVFAAWRLSQSKGQWKGKQLLPAKAVYTPTYVTCGVTALTMIAALAGGATVAYYAIFVLVIWLFCLAVYYTVGLM